MSIHKIIPYLCYEIWVSFGTFYKFYAKQSNGLLNLHRFTHLLLKAPPRALIIESSSVVPGQLGR